MKEKASLIACLPISKKVIFFFSFCIYSFSDLLVRKYNIVINVYIVIQSKI